MKFREHRGSYAHSMATIIEFENRDGLIAICRNILEPLHVEINSDLLQVLPYTHDDRNGWDTHIVRLAGYGVLGFTDGAVPR